MKATLRYPKSRTLAHPVSPRVQSNPDEDDRVTQIAFYFFAGLLVLALLFFVVTFIL